MAIQKKSPVFPLLTQRSSIGQYDGARITVCPISRPRTSLPKPYSEST